jgi:Tol biopolymer transport system component
MDKKNKNGVPKKNKRFSFKKIIVICICISIILSIFYFLVAFSVIQIKGEKKIIDLSEYCDHPIFSPDGKKILYCSRDDGGYTTGIWIINKDGSNNKRLTEPRPSDRDYAEDYCFTPDGTKILYKEHIYPQKEYLWIMDIDGENKKQITFNETGDFDISPDGNTIVFSNSRFGGRESILALNLIDISGSNFRILVEIYNASFVDCPKFHPNGNKVYFSIIMSNEVERRGSGIETNRDYDFEGIWSIDIDGSNLKKIIEYAGSHPVSPWTQIAFSTDGKKLMHFGSCASHHMTLWISNSDGSNTIQIKGREGYIGRADINKNGNYVVYSISPEFGFTNDIKLYDVKSKSLKTLTSGIDPSFSPNGKEIVYVSNTDIFIISLENPITQIDINLIICILTLTPVVIIFLIWINIKLKKKKINKKPENENSQFMNSKLNKK